MALIASDGYEYEDLTQRLLGNPLDNDRNRDIVSLRRAGREEAEVRAYYEAYDFGEDISPEDHPARDQISEAANLSWKALCVRCARNNAAWRALGVDIPKYRASDTPR